MKNDYYLKIFLLSLVLVVPATYLKWKSEYGQPLLNDVEMVERQTNAELPKHNLVVDGNHDGVVVNPNDAMLAEDFLHISQRLGEIGVFLGQLLGSDQITKDVAAEFEVNLKVVFEHGEIDRKEKINLLRDLWRLAEYNEQAILLLQKTVSRYKPREITSLMLPLINSTRSEKVYISTLGMLRESYSDYNPIEPFDSDIAEDDVYREEDVLAYVSHNPFESYLSNEAFIYTRLQFGDLSDLKKYWEKKFTAQLSEIDAGEVFDQYREILLARRGEQYSLLESQIGYVDQMPEYIRERFVERVRQLVSYENHALSSDAMILLQQFLGGEPS